MENYCILNVDYSESYDEPVKYTEPTEHLDKAYGAVILSKIDVGTTNNLEAIWENNRSIDLDIFKLADAKIFEDDVVEIYILSNSNTTQSFDMHFVDEDQEFISSFTASGEVLVDIKSGKTADKILKYIEENIQPRVFAENIVVGDVANQIEYKEVNVAADNTESAFGDPDNRRAEEPWAFGLHFDEPADEGLTEDKENTSVDSVIDITNKDKKDIIKCWAEEDYESGHVLDVDDYREFIKLAADEGLTVNHFDLITIWMCWWLQNEWRLKWIIRFFYSLNESFDSFTVEGFTKTIVDSFEDDGVKGYNIQYSKDGRDLVTIEAWDEPSPILVVSSDYAPNMFNRTYDDLNLLLVT